MEAKDVALALRAMERRYAPAGGATAEAYKKQLEEWRAREPDREEVCTTRDATSAWLVLVLCERYGVRPFRRPRQKPTTICVRVPAGFMTKVFWPQVNDLVRVFESARAAFVDDVVTAWLGKEAASKSLFVDEEKAP